MRETYTAHISVWLHCLTASTKFGHAIGPRVIEQLSDLLDIPPSYGGIDMESLERLADKELLGSFAGISASLVSFFRTTELPVYIAIGEALDGMGDAS